MKMTLREIRFWQNECRVFTGPKVIAEPLFTKKRICLYFFSLGARLLILGQI